MEHYIAQLKHERQKLETAPTFQKAQAAARLFDVMIDTLESIDDRLTAIEGTP